MSFSESKESLLGGEHGIEHERYNAKLSKPRGMGKLRNYIPIMLPSMFLLASVFCNAWLMLQVRDLKASGIQSQPTYGTFSLNPLAFSA